MTIKTVAVLGATGQIGNCLSHALLENSQKVVVVSRKKTAKNKAILEALESKGAVLKYCEDYSDIESMSDILCGCDVVVASVQASKEFLEEVEPKLLKAAIKAGVKRFVPNEFGAHTQGLAYGDGVIFDRKKRFQEQLFASGIEWTLFYNGGIFDYFLPNLRFFDKITTFGDIDIPLYTHDIKDIGKIAALAVVDDRTANQCVQMDFNVLTQREMLKDLKEIWSHHVFEYEHISKEAILDMKQNAGDSVTAKKGEESDKERAGINYVCYVIGKLASFNSMTLRASELYPDFKAVKAEGMLADKNFVFENKS